MHALCGLVQACPEAPQDCIQRCDDRDYAGDRTFFKRYACLVSTDECAERAVCEAGEYSGGFGCLNWCRHQLECGESGGDLVECLDTCGQGLQGREGLTFTAAEACTFEAPTRMQIGACLGSEPAALCSTVCQEQARCQLIEDEESVKRPAWMPRSG